MFENQLKNIGLNRAQAAIFDYLLEHGEAKAGNISKETHLPRGVVYKALDELELMNLMEKQEKEKIARFRAAHPRNLEKLLEKKKNKLMQNNSLLQEIMPNLISNYNLTLNRPGVRFYEGRDGLEKILYDTLTSRSELYLMLNRQAMAEEKLFKEVNEEYKKRRPRAGVKKKILYAGSKSKNSAVPASEEYRELTKTRYLNQDSFPFKTNIHIYDNKISFFIIKNEDVIGILIEDKNIYELNKFWFEMLWKNAKK